MVHVFCDFDGTITKRDVTDLVLERLAMPEWLEIEAQWQKGGIGSADCMSKQIALIRATREEIDGVLEEVQIDEGFSDFAAFCHYSNIPITIISDGVDYFIHSVLKRHGLDQFHVIANKLAIPPDNDFFHLTSPWRDRACVSNAGVCKCRVVASAQGHRLYVGDGKSDFCVSSKPEIIFAKGTLAAHCKSNNITYTPYQNFYDVSKGLERLLQDIHMSCVGILL